MLKYKVRQLTILKPGFSLRCRNQCTNRSFCAHYQNLSNAFFFFLESEEGHEPKRIKKFELWYKVLIIFLQNGNRGSDQIKVKNSLHQTLAVITVLLILTKSSIIIQTSYLKISII